MRRIDVRIPLSVALAFLAALFFGRTGTAQEKAAYLRLRINPRLMVYVKFQNADLRMATTTKGLTAAKPIRMAQVFSDEIEFPEAEVPIPPEAVPTGYSKLRACFVVFAPSESYLVPETGVPDSYAYGHISFLRKDEKGGEWRYLARIRSKTGVSPGTAPVVPLPILEKIRLKLTLHPRGREIGIGITPFSGKSEMLDIQTRTGEPKEVQVRLLDSAGKVVAVKKGFLGDFRLEQGAPIFFLPVSNPGKYTCEAAMPVGPLGSTAKGAATVKIW